MATVTMPDRTSTKSSFRFPDRPIVLLDAFADMVPAVVIVTGDPPVETLSKWPHREQRVDAAVMTNRGAALLAGAVNIQPCALRDVSHLPRAGKPATTHNERSSLQRQGVYRLVDGLYTNDVTLIDVVVDRL